MNEKKQLFTIISIILIMGLLGGFGNFLFANGNLENISDAKNISIIKSLVLGIIGAGIIPLIPGLISSNIIDNEDEKTGRIYSRMIRFASLCLLASVFSTSILSDTFKIIRDKYQILAELDKQSKIIEKVKISADSAKVRANDANIKADQVYQNKKEFEDIEKEHNEEVKHRVDEIVKEVSQKEQLTNEEKKLFSKIQNTAYLEFSEIFHNLEEPDSIALQKVIESLSKKDLILKTTITDKNALISTAKWYGN